MCIEIGLESTRNPRVGEIFQRFDRYIVESFEKLFQQLKDEGRIAPALDIPTIGQGLHAWSATACSGAAPSIPTFDAEAVMPAVLQLIAHAPQSGRRRRRRRRRQQPSGRSEDRS